jgi:hypothetical protein
MKQNVISPQKKLKYVRNLFRNLFTLYPRHEFTCVKMWVCQQLSRSSKLFHSFVITSLLLLLCGCGYHFGKTGDEQTTISVPFVKGDSDGMLTNEIIRAISSTGYFEYRRNDGNLQLLATILSDTDDRIGYRYDRDPTTGKRRKNIVGTENRETINVEVKLIDTYTQEILLGPEIISASADYDYVDSNSIRDLTFINSKGHATTIIDFSLGQLDSIEGAHDDAQTPIFRKLAQKIVDGLIIKTQIMPNT